MADHSVTRKVVGPRSLAVCRRFREGFAPDELDPRQHDGELQTAFLSESGVEGRDPTRTPRQLIRRVS